MGGNGIESDCVCGFLTYAMHYMRRLWDPICAICRIDGLRQWRLC